MLYGFSEVLLKSFNHIPAEYSTWNPSFFCDCVSMVTMMDDPWEINSSVGVWGPQNLKGSKQKNESCSMTYIQVKILHRCCVFFLKLFRLNGVLRTKEYFSRTAAVMHYAVTKPDSALGNLTTNRRPERKPTALRCQSARSRCRADSVGLRGQPPLPPLPSPRLLHAVWNIWNTKLNSKNKDLEIKYNGLALWKLTVDQREPCSGSGPLHKLYTLENSSAFGTGWRTSFLSSCYPEPWKTITPKHEDNNFQNIFCLLDRCFMTLSRIFHAFNEGHHYCGKRARRTQREPMIYNYGKIAVTVISDGLKLS